MSGGMAPSSTSHPATTHSSPPQGTTTTTTPSPPKRSLRSRGSNAAANAAHETSSDAMDVDVVPSAGAGGGDARGNIPPLVVPENSNGDDQNLEINGAFIDE